jgi:hypothetical protein
MRKLTLIGMLALLSACGGHDHHDMAAQTPLPPATGGNGGPAAQDPFTTQVAAVAAAQPDEAEPAALDASAPTMPENTEPAPVAP